MKVVQKISLSLFAFSVMLASGSNFAFAQTEVSIDQVNEKFNEAGTLIQNKQYAEAIPVLEQVIDLALEAGEEAVPTLTQVQKLLPKMYFQVGVEQIRQKAYEPAVATLLKTEELADLYGDIVTMRQSSRLISNAYMAMGIDSFNSKDYAKALQVFSLGYKQDPQNVQLALYTAKSYAELDSIMRAADIYDEVIAAGAANSKFAEQAASALSDLETYMLIAAVKAAQANELDKVITFTDRIIAVNPVHPESNLLVIQVANNLKRYDTVISRALSAADAQIDAAKRSEIYLMLGVAYQNRDNKTKALEYLAKVTDGPKVTEAKAIITELNKPAI